MSLRRLFSHHSHGGHHHSRNLNSDSSDNFHQTLSVEIHEDPNEQCDVVQQFMPSINPDYTGEQLPYRARRRSSVQIFDKKKFIQSSSNQTTSSLPTDTDSNAVGNTSDDVCEL